jgi:shikimate 5-dehydrogenase
VYANDLEDAMIMGAVNTVVRKGKNLIDENTDGKGFLASLRRDGGVQPPGKNVTIPSDVEIVVNATSIGFFPGVADKPDVDYHSITEKMIVCDVVPDPPHTPFFAGGGETRNQNPRRAGDGDVSGSDRVHAADWP